MHASLSTIVEALLNSTPGAASSAREAELNAMSPKDKRGVFRYLRDKGYHVESVKVGGWWYAKISNPNYCLLGEGKGRYKGYAQWDAFVDWQARSRL